MGSRPPKESLPTGKQTEVDDPSRDWQGRYRYFDTSEQRWLINVPAEAYYVTGGDEVLFTTLGSCVSVCLYDSTYRVGGLNHFLLPEQPLGTSSHNALRYGCQ